MQPVTSMRLTVTVEAINGTRGCALPWQTAINSLKGNYHYPSGVQEKIN